MTLRKLLVAFLIVCDFCFILLFIGLLLILPLELQGGTRKGQVHIQKEGDNFQLIRNGKPFTIQGACGGTKMADLAALGANTLRVYDTIGLDSILDKAHKNELAVIVDIPIVQHVGQFVPYGYSHDYNDPAENSKLVKQVASVVRRYKDHPALLFWNLGNEVYYPPLSHDPNNFVKVFNELIDTVHKEDPDHPVATTLTFPSKQSLAGLMVHCKQLDLVGFNVFGGVNNLSKQLGQMDWFSRAFPFYISEWGYNGPWESGFTQWNAPIERSNAQKMKEMVQHFGILKPYEDAGSLGSLYFFWGEKLEGTHTWFSSHLADTLTSEITFTLKELWSGSRDTDKSMGLDHLVLDEKTAFSSLIFTTGAKKKARIVLNGNSSDSLAVRWELMKDPWDRRKWGIVPKPSVIENGIQPLGKYSATLNVPNEEGPYRLFVYVIDMKGNFATSNVPFYVLGNGHVN